MGSPPAPPCFNDVVEAQRWAAELIQKTEEEASRRGCRGSRAWEDAWRDALWKLAVQKRCVEVEARKHCNVPTVPQAAHASPPPPTTPSVAQDHRDRGQAEDALRRGAAGLERQFLEPVRRRLDVLDNRLARMLTTVQDARAWRRRNGQVASVQPACADGDFPVSDLRGATAAGPLPLGFERLGASALLDRHGQTPLQVLELRRQLAEFAAQAEAETGRRREAERLCENAERQLRRYEVEQVEDQSKLRRAESRVEDETRRQQDPFQRRRSWAGNSGTVHCRGSCAAPRLHLQHLGARSRRLRCQAIATLVTAWKTAHGPHSSDQSKSLWTPPLLWSCGGRPADAPSNERTFEGHANGSLVTSRATHEGAGGYGRPGMQRA